MKRKNSHLILLQLTLLIFFSNLNILAIDVGVSGSVRYYDNDAGTLRPLVNAKIVIVTYEPTISPAPTIYTDQNGEYFCSLNVYPDQVTVYIFFANSKIDLRGQTTTRSDSRTHLKMVNPPPYFIPGDEYKNMDFDFTGVKADYAKIFTLGNHAVDFAINNGYTPPQCVIKYPAEESIINNMTVTVNTSFYWPFYNVNSLSTIGFLNPQVLLINFLGHDFNITEKTVYLTRAEAGVNHRSTVFHEYAHFLMQAIRGDWPVSISEYLSGTVPFAHSWESESQHERLAFIEGWANFYASAVESWRHNPSSPYAGRYVSDGYIFSNLFENPVWYNPNVTNGYNHELYVAAAFFDFYDPAYGDDNFQTPFINILNVIGEKQPNMAQFVYMFARKQFQSDQQRNAAIPIMNNLNMNPVVPYGNATVNIKNNFNAGIINVDNIDVNTNVTGGVFSKTELWMSNKRLFAKEQMYDNYQRVFKHTDLTNQSPTWTTDNPLKKNSTELWNTYTETLTFTANFDKLCNITYNKICIDGTVELENNTIPLRDNRAVYFYANDTVINGRTYKFTKWNDGTTINPRLIQINSHQNITACYKGMQLTDNNETYSNNNQRKVVFASAKFSVYESMGKIWVEKNDLEILNNGL
ncbi:MAG TPA: hypothetical protein PLU49_11320, partial [Saprospiraceae bacterium]|nr:hypothetical protein [Saprospiraceae bacterium]